MALPLPRSLCAYSPANAPLKDRAQDALRSAVVRYFSPAVALLLSIPALPGWHRLVAACSWREADRLRAHRKIVESNVVISKALYESYTRELKGIDVAIRENEMVATRAQVAAGVGR